MYSTDFPYSSVESLFNIEVFSYDYLLLQESSLLDYKIDYFLDLLFSFRSFLKNSFHKTEVAIFNQTYEHIKSQVNGPKNATGLYSKAIKTIDRFNDIVIYDGGNISPSRMIASWLAKRKRVVVVSEHSSDYQDLKNSIGSPLLTNNTSMFKVIKIHNIIANSLRSISNLSPSTATKKDSPIVFDSASIKENSTVYKENGKAITLKKKLGTGGEATCFLDSDGTVCKIFNQKTNTTSKKNKIELMVSMKKFFEKQNISWPVGILKNKSGVFIGYYMALVEGAQELDAYAGVYELRKNVIKNRKNAVQLCLDLCSMFASLHSKYVIIGDINFRNILINPKTLKLYLVDTDSAQIDNFRNKVGFGDFYAPEQITDSYKKIDVPFLTEQSELFVLTRTIFQILYGSEPYAFHGNGGQNFLEPTKKGLFPYPLRRHCESGDYSKFDNRMPSQYAWDNTPDFVREEFYNVLNKYGNYYRPGKRPSAYTWVKVMEQYLNYLNNQPQGSKELELYPTSFANSSAAKYEFNSANNNSNKNTAPQNSKKEKIASSNAKAAPSKKNKVSPQPSPSHTQINNFSRFKIVSVDAWASELKIKYCDGNKMKVCEGGKDNYYNNFLFETDSSNPVFCKASINDERKKLTVFIPRRNYSQIIVNYHGKQLQVGTTGDAIIAKDIIVKAYDGDAIIYGSSNNLKTRGTVFNLHISGSYTNVKSSAYGPITLSLRPNRLTECTVSSKKSITLECIGYSITPKINRFFQHNKPLNVKGDYSFGSQKVMLNLVSEEGIFVVK